MSKPSIVETCESLLNGNNSVVLNISPELSELCTSASKIDAMNAGYVIQQNIKGKTLSIKRFLTPSPQNSAPAAVKSKKLEKPDPNVPFSSYYAPAVIDDIIDVLKSDRTVNIWLYGPTQCIAGETKIRVNRGGKGSEYPIRYLYEMSHGVKSANWDRDLQTNVRSFKDGKIGLNPVFDIVYSGVKSVIKIELSNGFFIRLTKNHPIMTSLMTFVDAGLLKVGDSVMVDTMELLGYKVEKKISKRDHICNLWFHPFARRTKTDKESRGYTMRVKKYQAIYDAAMNNLNLDDFITITKKDEQRAKNLKYTDPSKFIIHHINGDAADNSLSNLECLTRKEHAQRHHNECNFGQGIPSFSEIVKISEDGAADTYDIKCVSPYHNFVANGIVVHNCGKTTAVRYVGYKLGRKIEPINCKGDMDSHHFFGHNTIINGNIVFQKGAVERSMTEGLDDNGKVIGEPGILFIDEAAAMPTEIGIGLNNTLETGSNVRTLTLPEDGNRVVKSHPGWRVMLAGNNNGTGASSMASQMYTAQQCSLDASQIQRISMTVRFGYDRRAEEQIIRVGCDDDQDVVPLFLQFKQGIRDALKRGELITPFSTKRVIDIFDLYRVFSGQLTGKNISAKKLALGKAIYYSAYEMLTEDEKKKYDELWYPISREIIGRWSPAMNTAAETDYI